MKKIQNLVEEHLAQKDLFEEEDELEENSLVKSTVNDLLEGNVDSIPSENLGRDVRGLKSKVFPLEDAFSSKTYAGKTISRKSLEFESYQTYEVLKSDSDDSDESVNIQKHSGRNADQNNLSSGNSNASDDLISEEESMETDEVEYGDDNHRFENKKSVENEVSIKSKKKVNFDLPLQDTENSLNDEETSVEEDDDDSNVDESDIEDDLSDSGDVEDHSSFLYSKRFKDEPSEIEKGMAIRNQLSIWEVLLESRIMLQKCLVTSNKLPKPDKFNEISSQFLVDEKDVMIECKEKVWNLLEKLILIQDKLRKQSHEFMESRLKRTESNDDDDDDDDNCDGDPSLKVKRRKLIEYPEILENQYNEYIPYRDSVIQKWNDRTKIASGKWAKSNFSAFDQPILKQIEQIMSDKNRLIQRTFVKRSQYSIFGEEIAENQGETGFRKVNNETDNEIFDDDDFYHKLLRDYIERKTSDISDPTQLGRKWIQLQSLRNKMKRKIDTRRTKGRKIKFDVHPKLVNFMAPVAIDCWEDNAVNELFMSVFGKNLINS